LVKILLYYLEKYETPKLVKKIILMSFMTDANKYTNKRPSEWAEVIFKHYQNCLVGHEKLQTIAVYVVDDLKKLDKKYVIDAIIELRNEIRLGITEGEKFDESLEKKVCIIWPLVFSILKFGDEKYILDILSAWYRGISEAEISNNVLIITPAHNGGAGYLWPEGRLLYGTGDASSHDIMTRAFSEATGTYYRGTDGDHPTATLSAKRWDIPNAVKAENLKKAMQEHYNLQRLKDNIPPDWKPSSIVVFPNGPEPIQALISSEMDISAPLQISFEKALPNRNIKNISVWVSNGIMHASFEVAAINYIAKAAGWSVRIYEDSNASIENFRDFYEDKDADILWVISHGSFDRFNEQNTGLVLSDNLFISSETIKNWTINTTERRLLVLNSCSSATAQGRGGRAIFGFAHGITSSRQMVVAHLWPIPWLSGLAFGAAFIANLMTEDIEKAFYLARINMQDPEYFHKNFAECPQLTDRIDRSDMDMKNFLFWSCPVLIC